MRMRSKRQNVIGFFYRREPVTAEDFNRHTSGKVRQVELNHLCETRKIHDHENGLVFVAAKKRQHLGVVREKKFESASGKGLEIFAGGDHAARPPEQRRQIFLLILD